MVKFPIAAEYIIDPEGKRPMNERVEVLIIHTGNINDWNGTVIHGKLHPVVNDDAGNFVAFKSLRAIQQNNIPPRAHELFEYIRDHEGKTPEWGVIHLIAERDEHGGIPVTGKPDIVKMDILSVIENMDTDNLRKQGEGPGENNRNYLYHTIVHHNIPERNLIGMWDWVEIGKTGDLTQRLFLYATNKDLIVSFPIWKRIQHLFLFRAPYLLTPNFLEVLTEMDNDTYVRTHRSSQQYYRQHWDDVVKLSREKRAKIIRKGLRDFVPLFKFVHAEEINGKYHIFFQKCRARSGDSGDWNWANYLITGDVEMCVSSLGWVSGHGIAPIKIKKDPTTHQGVDEHDNVSAGAGPVTASGHKYTLLNQHNNCPYRVQETAPGSRIWEYPGFGNLVSSRRFLLERWASLTQSVQGQGALLIRDGHDNDQEVATLVELLERIKTRRG